jgi:arginase family enzyme
VGLLRDLRIATEPRFVHRRLGAIAPSVLAGLVANISKRGDLPLLLGGDHGLTWYSHQGLASTHGRVSVLHFDAHHDQWPTTTVSNYSVIHAIRSAGANVEFRGVREPFPNPDETAHRIPSGSKVHISLDIDVLAPELFAAVSFPSSSPLAYTPHRLQRELVDAIRDYQVVGIDLVEWCSQLSTEQEMGIISSILDTICSALGCAPWPRSITRGDAAE